MITKMKEQEEKTGINFLLYDSKEKLICIHKRNKGGKKWDLFGGGTKDAEKSKDTLFREAFEELGIKLENRKRIILEKIKNKTTYIVYFPFSKRKLIKLDEGSGFMWESYEYIEKLKNNDDIDEEALRLLKIFKEKILI